MESSELSSLPPEKPIERSSDTWDDLGEIIDQVEENYVTTYIDKDVMLEIIDIDEQGIATTTVTENNTLSINDTCFNTVVVWNNKGNNTQYDPNHNLAEENIENENLVKNIEENPKNAPTRKRTRNHEFWKQNIRKQKRQRGEEYLDSKGKLKPAKQLKTATCHSEKCTFKCGKTITEEERKYIHKQFWKLNDEGKVHFYSKHIKRTIPLRKRTKEELSKQKYSHEYHFNVSGVKIRVCQEYFLNTLDISKHRIYYFFKKNKDEDVPDSPSQGKHKKKFISNEKKDEVRAHINSFPSLESHYCRAYTNKKYLERGLSLRKMYDLYRSSTENPVKFHMYSQIFNTEYNISFFKPKKDLCDKCELFKVLKQPTPEQTEKQEAHIRQKNIGNAERDRDRTRYVNDDTVGVVTFDLQNTFSLPKANISNFYYKTKLCCYNLTAHLDKTKVIYNAVWHEFICGRGAIHIANGMFRILKQIMIDNPHLKRIILWSDSCVTQNRNSVMSFAMQYFLQSQFSKHLEVIEQKLGEPGHGNVQEIDAAHSCIEKYIRNLEIWSPLSLIRTLLSIPSSWKLKFKVLQMKPSDYLNFQKVSKKLNYSTVPYSRVKNIIYTKKNASNLEYKESFESDSQQTKLQSKVSKFLRKKKYEQDPFTDRLATVELESNISDLKRKHLTEMLPYVPDNTEKVFYENLLHVKNTPTSTSKSKKGKPKATK